MSTEQVADTNDAAPDLSPREILASNLINKWVAIHGRPIPWKGAVEITAIIVRMPEAERLRLLALDDAA